MKYQPGSLVVGGATIRPRMHALSTKDDAPLCGLAPGRRGIDYASLREQVTCERCLRSLQAGRPMLEGDDRGE